MTLLERVETRLAPEMRSDQVALLLELCDLASVRICLRVRASELPELLQPIAADVVVKAWRRSTYEGISTESKDKISTSFVENILDEYADDLDAYVAQADEENGKYKVRFF